MQDAGLAIMESMNATIYNNVVEDDRYGLRISLGGAYNEIYGNTFDSCSDGESRARLRCLRTILCFIIPRVITP